MATMENVGKSGRGVTIQYYSESLIRIQCLDQSHMYLYAALCDLPQSGPPNSAIK